MDGRRMHGDDPNDAPVAGAGEALHVLGWMFTLGALLLLVMALQPRPLETFLGSRHHWNNFQR